LQEKTGGEVKRRVVLKGTIANILGLRESGADAADAKGGGACEQKNN